MIKPIALMVFCALPLLSARAMVGSGVDMPTSTLVRSETVTYVCDGDTLEGTLAWNPTLDTKLPVVLVVHEWWGNNAYSQRRAEMLAEAGYMALAVDMYGKGRRAEEPGGAMALASDAYSDPARLQARFEAARRLTFSRPEADTTRVAAIGYCFGGGVLLGLARAGVELDALASFHGSLGTKTPASKGSIKPALLVLNGEADPFVPAEEVAAFRAEMDAADARLTYVGYPGATHAFTNPASTETGKRFEMPVEYNEAADADSWTKLLDFLATELK